MSVPHDDFRFFENSGIDHFSKLVLHKQNDLYTNRTPAEDPHESTHLFYIIDCRNTGFAIFHIGNARNDPILIFMFFSLIMIQSCLHGVQVLVWNTVKQQSAHTAKNRMEVRRQTFPYTHHTGCPVPLSIHRSTYYTSFVILRAFCKQFVKPNSQHPSAQCFYTIVKSTKPTNSTTDFPLKN